MSFDSLNPRSNPIVQEYVLPDYATIHKGYIRNSPNAPKPNENEVPRKDLPVLYMSNERFTAPELLFHPSDIGAFPWHHPTDIYRC